MASAEKQLEAFPVRSLRQGDCDLAVSKRVHPATIVGGGAAIAVQCAAALIWQSTWWHDSSIRMAQAIRAF